MTREESWNVAGVTGTILRHVQALGYVVSVHRLSGSLLRPDLACIEMHAIDGERQHVARVALDEPGEVDYRCACLLAQMVGIDLEG